METDREDELTLAVIAERLRSLRTISERGFLDIQRQLDDVRSLPLRVEALAGRVNTIEKRQDDMEELNSRGLEWRRGSLPIIVLTLMIALSSVGAVIAQLH